MILIHLERKELWDDENGQFVYFGPEKPLDVYLEHSLVSIYKWESKYHKSYLDTERKTVDESFDYMAMMAIGEYEDNLDPMIFRSIEDSDVKRLENYLSDSMTATIFSKNEESKNAVRKAGENFITAEIIYYYMTVLNIPFECERWHINKLLTLIRVCSIKNEESAKGNKKKKRFTTAEMASRRARMEAARAKYKK